jgi:hypothetical protein
VAPGELIRRHQRQNYQRMRAGVPEWACSADFRLCVLCDDTCFSCAAAKAVSVAARHLSRCGADAVSERVWAGLNGPGGAARFRSLSCSAGGAAAATDIAAASFVSDDATTVGSVGGVATGMAAVGV